MRYVLIFLLFVSSLSFGQKGPGGVSENLVLWVDATEIKGRNNQAINSWEDKSSYPVSLSGYARPRLKTKSVNGLNSLYFNGYSNYYVSPYASKLQRYKFSLFITNKIESSDYGATVSFRGHVLMGSKNGATDHDWSYATRYNSGSTYREMYSSTSSDDAWTSQTITCNPYISKKKRLYVNNRSQGVSTDYVYYSNEPFRVGVGYYNGSNYHFKGNVGEVIMYDKIVNSAERTIVNNYLSAKYDFALSSKDYYKMDDSGYDYDVTGIGRNNSNNQHLSSTGTGMISISRNKLSDGQYLFTGSDRGHTNFDNYNNGPTCYICMDRKWGVTNRREVMKVNISFQFDSIDKPDDIDEKVYIIIDRNKNGDFSDETPVTRTSQSGNKVDFNNIQLNNGETFTLAVKANPTKTNEIHK